MGITPDPRPRPKRKDAAAEAREAAAAAAGKVAVRRRRRWTIFLVAAGVLAVLLIVINFDLFTPGAQAAEAEALRALRQITTAQFVYSARHPEQGFASSLGQLAGDRLIDARLASGQVAGYTFTLTPGEADEEGRLRQFTLTGRALNPGQRNFFTDQAGGVRVTQENRDATASDPPLEPPTATPEGEAAPPR